MTQEIKVNLTLAIEGDIRQSKTDIENFLADLMTTVINTKTFSLSGYKIDKILQEAEIYAPDPPTEVELWGFVEKYHPNYYSCDEIMRYSDLGKILNGELNGDADIMFYDEFQGNLELAKAALVQSAKNVYERSIVGYQKSRQGSISIVWGLEDIEVRAKENGYLLKDGEAQKVLDMLKGRHDCKIGVNWNVIDDYLSSIVPDSLEDDGIEWTPIKYKDKEYLARQLRDPQHSDSLVLIAPISLYDAMNFSLNADAGLIDESIAYYATQEELEMQDEQLLKLIYG